MDISGDLVLIIGSVFLLLCGPRWSKISLDTNAVLLSCLMFGGRSRWSGKSLQTRGDLLFILALIS